MSHGERGDDLEHLPERRGKPGDGLPASPVEHEHRRQEQRQQEQDMVEADPDMPYTFTGVIDELGERRDLRELEALGRPLRTEDGRVRSRPVFEPQQSPVLRIKVGEEAVADFESRHLLRAGGRKAHHRISAVAVVIDQKSGRVRGAVGAFRTQLQSRQGIGCDIRVMRPHFAPGDITVSAVVQADREIEVAQGDVPLSAQVRTLCTDREVTVARLVRVRGCKEEQRREQRPHRFRAFSFSAVRRRSGSSCPERSSQSSASCAASGSFIASAASSRMRASRGSRCSFQFSRASARAFSLLPRRVRLKRASSCWCNLSPRKAAASNRDRSASMCSRAFGDLSACSARARRRSRMSDFTQSTSNGMTSSARRWSSRKSAYAASKNWSLIGSKYAARKCSSACFTSPCRKAISARRVSTQTLTSGGMSAFLANATERARYAAAALPVVPSR